MQPTATPLEAILSDKGCCGSVVCSSSGPLLAPSSASRASLSTSFSSRDCAKEREWVWEREREKARGRKRGREEGGIHAKRKRQREKERDGEKGGGEGGREGMYLGMYIHKP
jgi:hypothetical protein